MITVFVGIQTFGNISVQISPRQALRPEFSKPREYMKIATISLRNSSVCSFSWLTMGMMIKYKATDREIGGFEERGTTFYLISFLSSPGPREISPVRITYMCK